MQVTPPPVKLSAVHDLCVETVQKGFLSRMANRPDVPIRRDGRADRKDVFVRPPAHSKKKRNPVAQRPMRAAPVATLVTLCDSGMRKPHPAQTLPDPAPHGLIRGAQSRRANPCGGRIARHS